MANVQAQAEKVLTDTVLLLWMCDCLNEFTTRGQGKIFVVDGPVGMNSQFKAFPGLGCALFCRNFNLVCGAAAGGQSQSRTFKGYTFVPYFQSGKACCNLGISPRLALARSP